MDPDRRMTSASDDTSNIDHALKRPNQRRCLAEAKILIENIDRLVIVKKED